ncbi:ABC transporter ATP-binding protein [Paenibacillus pabuli]|nr:ABC transporter ATP-binding protein [Paenibacillus pabuli]
MYAEKRTYTTRGMITRLWTLTGRYRMFIVLLLCAALAISLIEVGYMESIRRLVKGATESHFPLIYSGLAIGVSIVALRVIVTAIMTWLETLFQQKSLLSLQMMLLTSLGDTAPRELTHYHTGDLTARVWTSAKEAQNGLNQHGIELAKNIIQLILAFAYFSWVNLPLSLAIIIFTLVYPVVTMRLGSRLQRRHDQLNADAAARDALLTEVIQAPLEIRSYGLKGYIYKRYQERMNQVFRQTMSVSVLQRLSEAAGRVSTYGGMILILYLGGIQVLHGRMDVGGLAAFLIASSQLTRPIEAISGLWNGFIGSASHAARIFEVMDLEKKKTWTNQMAWPLKNMQSGSVNGDLYENLEKSTADREGQIQKAGMHIQHIYFSYAEKATLSDVTFTAETGKLTVITGPSGCGKSTLLKCIADVQVPSSGSVQFILGHIPGMKAYSQVYVPQQVFIFTGTVEENIAFGQEQVLQERIVDAACLAQVHDAIMRQTSGYHTVLEPLGSSMSGGELQRISLARAILREPDVILLDEPTSSQDPVNEQRLNTMFNKLTAEKKKTIIAVTHRVPLLEQADQVVYMREGRIVDTGSHHELLARPNGYRSYIEEQVPEVEEHHE